MEAVQQDLARVAGGCAMNDRDAAAPASDSERVPFVAWMSMAILLLLTVFSYVDRTIISLMVDPIKGDLGISDVQVSLLQGFSFAFVFALASIPMGWLSDRYSRRAVAMIGVLVWSSATILCGMARNFGQLFAARLGVGVGEAALPPSAYGIIAELFPKKRLATAIGLLAAGSALGSSLAYAVGGVAIGWSQHHAASFGMADWQLVFIIVGLPSLVLAPLLLLIPRSKRPAGASSTAMADSKEYRAWLRLHGGYVILTALGVGCYASVAYAVSAWVPAYLFRKFGLDAATIGLTLGALHAVTGLVGFVGSGWLVDRLHSRGVPNAHFRYIQFAGLSCGALGLVCFSLVPSVPLVLVFLGLIYVLAPVTGPALAHIQLSSPSRFHGRNVALFQLIMNLLAMIAGPSSAALFSQILFGGPQHIGLGIAATFAVFSPLGFILVTAAKASARRALLAEETRS